MSFYHRLSFQTPVDQEELFSVELFARGALGLVVEEADMATRLVAYFSDPLPEGLSLDGESWAARGIRVVERQRCEEQDWFAVYRAAIHPIEIGERFLVDPGEPDARRSARGSTSAGRVLLRVPARRAFETGSHESTRLVLEWLEDLELRGLRVLDLGAGSGILCLAAMSLGASAAVGLDIDPVASFVSREVLRLNAHPVLLVAGDLSCLGEVGFDLALVNILPSEWLDDSGRLARVLAPDGGAIVSGLSKRDTKEVSDRLARAGLAVRERRVAGEWAALRVSRGAR